MTDSGKDGDRAGITACLWFDTDGEDAANFYTSVFPSCRIDELTAGGGEQGPYGWVRDRCGVSRRSCPSTSPRA